ncbi:MAG TPA: response regulator [Longimicrobium sp.]|nr:response regulator [Longimicrobium sp.]
MSTPLVLVVDPNDDSRTIYATILRHGGFSVAVAACPERGLVSARGQAPDLVVLSVTPPRAEALRTVRNFRGEPVIARVPLLVLSTVPAPAERALLMAEGVAEYVAKPCTPLELLAAVRRILGI